MNSAFAFTRNQDGTAELVFDLPNEKVNKFSASVVSELEGLLNKELGEKDIQALVIRSGKPNVFIAGADIDELAALCSTDDAAAKARKGQEVFSRIAALPYPTIAVIDGACLGGGLELALACSHRIVTDNKKTQLGLPEVQLGIIPGWGGTQRLPRVVGLVQAMTMILSGKPVDGKKAAKIGLADLLAPAEFVTEKTCEFVQRCLDEGSMAVRRRPRKKLPQRLLEGNPAGRAVAFAKAAKDLRRRTKGHYPAPVAALELLKKTCRLDVDRGLRMEAETFARLAVTPVCNNLIRLFHVNQSLKKDAGEPPDVAPRKLHSAAVLGAGVMGGGIAWLLSRNDNPVRLKDIAWDAIAKGFAEAADYYEQLRKRRKLQRHEVTVKMHHITGTVDYSGFGTADVVIEAIVEKMDVKKAVFAEVEDQVPGDAIICSNTSALSITEMATSLKNPERFVGLHFFNPVNRMPLVEVIPGKDTSDETVASAVALVRELGKTPVVVKDSPGFLVNRILIPYLNEAGLMLQEGIDMQRVDKLVEAFGMPMGPFVLADEAGIDVGLKAIKEIQDAYTPPLKPAPVMEKVVENGWLGKKVKKGFYVHDGKKLTVNSEVTALVAETGSGKGHADISDRDIVDRAILTMVNEAARCLDEEVVTRAEFVDMAMIMGTGFPPFRGGLLRYADERGIEQVVNRLRELKAAYGDRFEPADCLVKMAGEERTFTKMKQMCTDAEGGGAVMTDDQKTVPDKDDHMVIDTSRMSKGKREALEAAEAARDSHWRLPSFARDMFMGRFRPDLVFPFPRQPADQKAEGDALVDKIRAYLAENLDPDEVDVTREVPEKVVKDLLEMGLFTLKIPKEYEGLGLSQVNYNRIMLMVSSYCGATAVLASAHQSIGVPQPLKMFGTEEQKKKYFPRIRQGAICAFALTEPGVGSDPSKMVTEAVPSEDGTHYMLNGVKQWCTNAPVAELIVVMAKTPPKMVRGKERQQISAFIVERNMPGVELTQRCEFMGLGGMQNGNLKFTDVKVPVENMLGLEGKGLKLALGTLNIGRLTLPAACTGLAKQCLSIARRYGNKRVQWGKPVGHHEAGRDKTAFIASTTLAMEAVTMLASHYVDLENTDIRLEAAMAKYFCSENGWTIVDQTLQLCGGRGYEKATSLKERGEDPYPVERMMRDARINTIIEGTSEIMRLFLAREAVDEHLKMASNLIKRGVPMKDRLLTLLKLMGFYLWWYPVQWLSVVPFNVPPEAGKLSRHLRYVARTEHRLARGLFHAMARYRESLDKRQIVLGHLIDIGTELFAMTATCSYALSRAQEEKTPMPVELADLFCRQARRRIREHFHALCHNDNKKIGKVARKVSDGAAKWLEKEIVWIGPEE